MRCSFPRPCARSRERYILLTGAIGGATLLYVAQKYREHRPLLADAPAIIKSDSQRSVSAFELGQHKSLESCWVAIDGEVWDVTDFEFLEGKPYNQTNIDNSDHVAVITDQLRDQYFGDLGESVIGKSIDIESVKFVFVTNFYKKIKIVEFSSPKIHERGPDAVLRGLISFFFLAGVVY